MQQQPASLPQIIQTQEIYFIPPPINEFNKTYYQQLMNADNPIQHATKSYVSFSQLYMLDQPQWEKHLQAKTISKKSKKELMQLNRNIFEDMKKYMRALSGFTPLSDIKIHSDSHISDSLIHFKQEIESFKRFQIRLEVCNKLAKETQAIRARTKEIHNQLQKIKDNFNKALLQDKIIAQNQ